MLINLCSDALKPFCIKDQDVSWRCYQAPDVPNSNCGPKSLELPRYEPKHQFVTLIQFYLVSQRNLKNLFCNGFGSIPSVQRHSKHCVSLFILFQWERLLLQMFLPSHILLFCSSVRKMRKSYERRSVLSVLSGSSCRGGWRHVQVRLTGFLSGLLLLLWRTSTAVRWGHCLVGR